MTDFSPFNIDGVTPITDLTQTRVTPATQQTQQIAVGSQSQPLGFIPDLGAATPSSLGRVFSVGQSAPAARVVPQQQNYVKALSNKYADPDVAQAFSTLGTQDRNGLIQYDAQRVASGSPPMTKDQTLRAIQTIVTGKPATQKPDRSILNVPGNILTDLGDIIKSIPRLPGAMLSELGQLGQVPDTPGNSIVDLLRAPGIRMLPGTYTAANLLSGGEGAREAATHPLMTFLDVLPGASKMAEGTATVRAAQAAADAAGSATRVRPLGVLATRTLNDAGELVPNALGQTIHNIRDTTKIGQGIEQAFGRRARDIQRAGGREESRIAAQMAGTVNDGPVAELTARAARLNPEFVERYGWDQAQFSRLHDIASYGDPAAIGKLAPEELAYIGQAREITQQFGEMMVADREGLARIVDPRTGNAEFYPSEKAGEITRARALASHSERMANLRRQYLSEQADLTGPLDIATVDKMLDGALKSGDKMWTRREMRGITQVLEAHGYDTNGILKFQAIGSRTGDWNPYMAALTDLFDQQTPATRLPATEIIAELRKHRDDTMAQMLAHGLAKRDTKLITHALNAIEDRGKFKLPLSDNADFATTVRSLRRRYEFEHGTGRRFTDDLTGRMANRADKMLTKAPPARFEPRIVTDAQTAATERAAARAEQTIGRNLTPEEAGRIAAAVQDANWSGAADLGLDSDHLRRIYSDAESEIAQTWRDLAEQGVDPVFVHNVSLSRARGMQQPKIGPVPNSLSQVRDRARDFTPGVRNLGVAVTHQGVEMLTRAGSERFAQYVVDNYGVTQQQLTEMYRSHAGDLANADPTFSTRGHLQRLIDRGWVRFNPDEAGYSWGGARLQKYRDDAYFIPKALAKNMKAMHDPGAPLIAAMAPITRTFRLSVVGLSPRTQLYNILGGATMLMGETGPGAFKYARQAMEMVRNPASIINEELRATIGSMKAAQLDDGTLAVPRTQVMAGKTLGRMWNQVQEARSLGKVKDLFGKAVDKSLDLNGFFDDTYRVMGYLYGRDKAMVRGLAPEVAERAGMELTRKVMMDWTGLTPFERNTLKAIFPFYGFMNHAMRYVMRFPVDHPLRAEIVGAFGRAEAEDSQVLPSSFLSALFFGDTSADGSRKAFNTAPINPFGDVANMFTLAGFLSATNPVIGTALESVGLVRGEAELYPTLRYDPETGRLSAVHGNPLLKLVENTIPQTAVLSALLGVNAEFRDRLQRDPAAASRFLMSASGLPILWRNWNLPTEIAKAEVARGKSEDSARNEALRSGDWTQALRYPGLGDDYERLLRATPQELAQYQPQGADIYTAMIEQALGLQTRQAQKNAAIANQQARQGLPIAQTVG